MFDDLQDLLGIKLTEGQKVALKELARRKNDTLRVFNPLPEDYFCEWGLYDQVEPGGLFLIPSKSHDVGFGPGFSNQPRYIATKFFKESSLLILQSTQRIAINKENERRKVNGFARLSRTIDNDEESAFLMQEGLIINHDKYLDLLPKIICGIVHEWGLDVKPMKRFQRILTMDELQAITDRKVGTDIDPEAVGITKISDPITKPEEQISNDPLAGVAA